MCYTDIYKRQNEVHIEVLTILKIRKECAMKLQQLLSQTRKAIDDYRMIDSNDKIAIGISGGKDSLALLYSMQALKKFYPKPFSIHAITINLGYEDFNLKPITQLCRELEIPYSIVDTQIAKIIFEERKESNPCSLCAKMRKGALNQEIIKLGCNKVAYAHHKDDFIETMLLSLLFEGRFYSFPPKFHLDQMNLTVIRPLMYVSEKDIIGFKNKYNLPVVKSSCPVDGNTKREYVKQLVKQLNKENPGTRERMFNSIIKGNIFDWPHKFT